MLDITASSILGGPHVLTERFNLRHKRKIATLTWNNLFSGNVFDMNFVVANAEMCVDMICGAFYEQTLSHNWKSLLSHLYSFETVHEAIIKIHLKHL